MNRKVIFADKSTRHGERGPRLRQRGRRQGPGRRGGDHRADRTLQHRPCHRRREVEPHDESGPGAVGRPVPSIRHAAAQRFRRQRPASLGRGARRRRPADSGRLERLYPGQALRGSLQHRQGRDPLVRHTVATVGQAGSKLRHLHHRATALGQHRLGSRADRR